LRRRGRPLLLAASLAGTALFGLLQLPPLRRLAERGYDIFDFELIRTTARAQAMLSAWGPVGRDAARASLWLDFAFIACWTAALVLAGTMLAARARRSGAQRLVVAGRLIVGAAVVAGTCDVLQNVVLLLILHGHSAQPFPALAFSLSLPTFVLLAAAVVGSVAGHLLLRRRPRVITS
jgi:hypothetical protein